MITLQYSNQVPTTGFSITVPNWANVLALAPAGTLATGTITTPATAADGQLLILSSTQIVTALTMTANTGQTILGAATSLAVNTPVRWMFNAPTQIWTPV